MSSRLLASFFFLVLVGGCNASSIDCGSGGESFEDDLGRYCAYAVIEGGFLCPDGLPHRIEFGTGMAAVCTDRDIPPGDLPRGVCSAAGYPCEEGHRTDGPVEVPDAGPMPLPAASCAPACSEGGPPPPPGLEGESTCYDGCNWCLCTNQGPVDCTARACLDGGPSDAGP